MSWSTDGLCNLWQIAYSRDSEGKLRVVIINVLGDGDWKFRVYFGIFSGERWLQYVLLQDSIHLLQLCFRMSDEMVSQCKPVSSFYLAWRKYPSSFLIEDGCFKFLVLRSLLDCHDGNAAWIEPTLAYKAITKYNTSSYRMQHASCGNPVWGSKFWQNGNTQCVATHHVIRWLIRWLFHLRIAVAITLSRTCSMFPLLCIFKQTIT